MQQQRWRGGGGGGGMGQLPESQAQSLSASSLPHELMIGAAPDACIWGSVLSMSQPRLEVCLSMLELVLTAGNLFSCSITRKHSTEVAAEHRRTVALLTHSISRFPAGMFASHRYVIALPWFLWGRPGVLPTINARHRLTSSLSKIGRGETGLCWIGAREPDVHTNFLPEGADQLPPPAPCKHAANF
jgi:hypothetical protein